MELEINYQHLSYSKEYYKNLGYVYKELDWIIPKKYIEYTYKEYNKYTLSDNSLLGSAEQVFIKEMIENDLNGKFQCITPCFRNDVIDELHQEYFMKNELFFRDGSLSFKENLIHLEQVILDAKTFFIKISKEDCEVIETSKNCYDILLNNIEVGSYGIRQIEDLYYIYGTGLAEPRFSVALHKNKGE